MVTNALILIGIEKMAKKKKATRSAKAKPRTMSQVMGDIATATDLTRKEVASVFDTMAGLIKKDLKRGPGVFTVPGLMKIRKVHKAARPKRKGINPFTGEEAVFKAKPAHNVIKVTALKGLKDMV